MSMADDPQDPLERMAQISDSIRNVGAEFSTLRQAWPDGEVFRGTDASGALTVEMTAKGEVTLVVLDDNWSHRIGHRSLARAVNEAIGAAQASVGNRWHDSLVQANQSTVEPEPQPRDITLEEYRAIFPAATTRDELRERALRRAEARAARERGENDEAAGAARESFMSPHGRLKVTRSGAQLTGLEIPPYAFGSTTADELGEEVVAALAEIELRARGDMSNETTSGPINRMRVLREHL